MRKALLLVLLASVVAGCGGGSMSAVATERYLKTQSAAQEAHCLPGSGGWTYLCSVRRDTRVVRIGVVVRGKRVEKTTVIVDGQSPVPPVPDSPEAKAAAFVDQASAICSRRMTLVAAIPHPQNVYAAYRLMGAYLAAEREEASSLRRLDSPGEKADGVRALISAADRAGAAAEAYRAALLKRDRIGVARALAARSAAAVDEAQAAEKLGLHCAVPGP